MEDLIEKIDVVSYIGQYVKLTQKGEEFVGLSPFTNEKTPSFFVHPEKKCWYCFSCGDGGSIIKFVQKYHKVSYEKAINMLASWAHISIKNEEPIVKLVRKYKKREEEIMPVREELPPDIMEQYKDIIINSWVEEGISKEVLKKYNVRFDEGAGRIVFPVWDINGRLINIKGRAAHPKWKEFGMAKYIYYYPLGKNDLLWGYHWHLDDIKKKNEVIIFEGEKSVMKLESNGIFNSVSIGTSHISKEQFQILLKLRADVVMALDKDKSPLDDKNFNLLAKYNRCYIIEDKEGLLGEKDAPIDQGIEVFQKLYNERRLVL